MGARIGPRLRLAEDTIDQAIAALEPCRCYGRPSMSTGDSCEHVDEATCILKAAQAARFPGAV